MTTGTLGYMKLYEDSEGGHREKTQLIAITLKPLSWPPFLPGSLSPAPITRGPMAVPSPSPLPDYWFWNWEPLTPTFTAALLTTAKL